MITRQGWNFTSEGFLALKIMSKIPVCKKLVSDSDQRLRGVFGQLQVKSKSSPAAREVDGCPHSLTH